MTERSYKKWRKSSRSGSASDNCVEVAYSHDTVAVRDSKHRHGPMLVVSTDQWRAFLDELPQHRGPHSPQS